MNWLEERTGIQGLLKRLLYEKIPGSAGWRNTLGSAAGALLLLQIFTGCLLMLFYVPHPDAAYASLTYIKESLRLGGLVHALHYWGGGFIVLALFIHLIRVFLSGAYKKPREVLWLTGLALFLVMFGLLFTGQLLPMNQAGYWASSVGVEIASSAPIVGPTIKQMLLGGDTLGALTLTRFYAAHVVLLPAVLALLVIFHIYLLRRHGPTRPSTDDTTTTQSFFPYQVNRDMVVVSLVLAALLGVAYLVGAPESEPSDPTDTTHIPRPEWYFMSHFEVLRFTPGSMKILATFVLPNVVLLLLAALPWIDRSRSTAFKQRRVVIMAGLLMVAAVVGLTVSGLLNAQKSHPIAEATRAYDPVEAGKALFEEHKCGTCHEIEGREVTVGPNLSGVGLRLKPEYMMQWLEDPQSFVPDTQMAAPEANRKQLRELVAYLQSLRAEP